jgi:hypothetical protein
MFIVNCKKGRGLARPFSFFGPGCHRLAPDLPDFDAF